MSIAPAALIVGAERAPLPYGLFSTFQFRPTAAARWESGAQFETEPCGDTVKGIGAWSCPDPDTGDATTEGLPKTLDTGMGDLGAAEPFTVYGEFACSPVGFDAASAQGRATTRLLTGEERRVEQAFWTGDLGNEPTLAGAATTKLTTAAVTPAVGLALLEQALADTYGAVGVLHMSRGFASALTTGKGLHTTTGGRLLTGLDTPVAAGAGYDGSGPLAGDAAPTATVQWVYATPALFGYRSDPFTSSNRPGDLLDRATNDLYAIAERSYLLGMDPCGVYAARIDLAPTAAPAP